MLYSQSVILPIAMQHRIFSCVNVVTVNILGSTSNRCPTYLPLCQQRKVKTTIIDDNS